MQVTGLPEVRTRRPGAHLSSGVRVAIAAMSVFIILSLFTPTPMIVLAAGVALSIILVLLWRRSEPPILMFPVLYQWSEVAVKPIISALNRTPVNSLADFGGDIQGAAYFGFAGVIALALGMRVCVGKESKNWDTLLSREVASLPLNKVLAISIALILFGQFISFVSIFSGGLRQIFLAVGAVGLCGVFTITYWCLKNRRGYIYIFGVMLFEIVIGLTGFFADFRAPLLVMCLAILSARPRLRINDMITLLLAGVILISVASFWSYVKSDYRKYVSGGSGSQVISVSFADRSEYIGREMAEFNSEKFKNGMDLLLARHSYIDFLSSTMEHVPAALPHENGARVFKSIVHILTPRILFPDKPPTESDSEVTVKYTGLPIFINESTSISIGYLGELYIDFGIVGSIISCFVFGWILCFGYKVLRSGKGPLVIRFGLCAVVAVSQPAFGTALIKLVGGIATAYIGAWLVQKFVIPRLITFVRLAPRRLRRPMAPAGEPVP